MTAAPAIHNARTRAACVAVASGVPVTPPPVPNRGHLAKGPGQITSVGRGEPDVDRFDGGAEAGQQTEDQVFEQEHVSEPDPDAIADCLN